MAERPAWVPDEIDMELPSAARVYDCLLGGDHNFAVDRMVAKKVLQVLPNGREIAGSNRRFLRRAARYMVDRGIRQFLDLGSGIPTVGNVHEIVQGADPECRVVYVEYDKVAVAHSRLLLQDNANATIVEADVCAPEAVLGARETTRFIDFDQPVGLLMVAVLHFVPDTQDPGGIVARYRDALPPGSLVALSHLTADHKPDEMATVAEAMRNTRDPMYFRSYDEVITLFDGLELVEPGLVGAPRWRPESGPHNDLPDDVYAGVGRKP